MNERALTISSQVSRKIELSPLRRAGTMALGALLVPLRLLRHSFTRLFASLDFYRKAFFQFTPQPGDIFIASYPRSGTTWLQMILYQLTTDGDMDMIAMTFDIAMFLSRGGDCVRGNRAPSTRNVRPTSLLDQRFVRLIRVRPDCDPVCRSPTVYAAPARRYGLRSTDAFPLSASKGTDVCSCATTHAPSSLRKQTVERTHMSTSRPFVIVPVTR